MTKPRCLSVHLVAGVERRPERRAVVPRRRLDEELAESGLLADLAVGDAVHRAPAGKTEPRAAGRFLHVPQHVESGAFERDLQRGCDRLVLRLQRILAPPRRAEQRLELRRKHRTKRRRSILPRHLDAFRPVPEVRQVELETAVVVQLDQRFDLAHESRLAVRRKAHHLEFIAVVGEAEVLRDRQIQQPQRVGEEHPSLDGQPRSGDAGPTTC